MVESDKDILVQQDYCRAKAAAEGSSLYYATLFEQESLKNKLFAIFALHYEIADCLTASPDPGVIRIKLHWWIEELKRLSQNQPRHPVTTSLLELVNEQKLSLSPIINYVATIESIISRPTINAVQEWLDHLCAGLGQIWLSAAGLSGDATDRTLDQIRRNGGTIFILDLLQNYRLLASRGYHFLPNELLSEFGLNSEQILSGEATAAVNQMFASLIFRLEGELDTYFQALSTGDIALSRYHLIMNRIAKTTCVEIRKDGCQLMRHRIALTPVRKLWIAYRTRLFK